MVQSKRGGSEMCVSGTFFCRATPKWCSRGSPAVWSKFLVDNNYRKIQQQIENDDCFINCFRYLTFQALGKEKMNFRKVPNWDILEHRSQEKSKDLVH